MGDKRERGCQKSQKMGNIINGRPLGQDNGESKMAEANSTSTGGFNIFRLKTQ